MTSKWLDRWIPHADNPQANERVRQEALVRITGATIAAVDLVLVIWFAVVDGPLTSRPAIYGVAFLATAIAAWKVAKLGAKASGIAVTVVLLLSLLINESTHGGWVFSALPWLAACPLVATVLVGPRAGLWMVALAGSSQVALHLLDRLGFPFPNLHHDSPDQQQALSLLNTLLAMLVVTVVGALYELSRRQSERLAHRMLSDVRRANRDLRYAHEVATKANAARTEFVANISHELRTPMNGVIGMVDLMQTSELSVEQREYAQTIHQSATSLLSIIDDILDFSKLEFDKIELAFQRYDLETTVDEALSVLASQAYDKGLELSATIDRDVPSEVLGDPGRLRQVLLNLISNAVKFTHSGEVSLNCNLVKLDDPTALLRFEVRDTGIGIPKHQRDRVFDSFYQTDTSSTRRHGGTGLGLAISKRLVELMGGQVGVDSVPGKGSSFYFTLPLRVPEDVLDQGDDRSGTFTGLRALCLVLGDRPRARRALVSLLEREGVLADHAPSLSEAFDKFDKAQAQELPYRVCIIDAVTTEQALSVADKIQRAPLDIVPAVVLLATPNQRDLRIRARALGFSSPVNKPARRAPLMAGVASALSDASRGRPLRTGSGRIEAKQPPIPGGRLLLAEDNETNRRTAMIMLRKMGYFVDVAVNGQEVLDRVSRHRYDAILMDCQMPDIDGYEAATRIRNRPDDDRHTTIIAMTANASPSDRRRCLDAGMNDYLPKPVRFEALRTMLDKWVHGAVSPDRTSGEMMAVPSAGVDLSMLQSLRNLAGEDQHMVNDLIETYLQEAPRVIADLSARLDADDATGVADAVHKLKSASGNLGANTLSELCFRLEAQARSANLDEAPVLVSQIRDEFSRVQATLHPLRGGVAPAQVRSP